MRQEKQPRTPERKVKRCKACNKTWDEHDIRIDPKTRALNWICK